MAKSFFTATQDSVLASGSNIFANELLEHYADYGVSQAAAAAYAAVNDAFQAAYRAAVSPSSRTRGTVAGKNSVRAIVRRAASDLARTIDGNPAVSDPQRIRLGISVRAKRNPRPAPGTPFEFKVSLCVTGRLALTWKCPNPKGSSGTVYQIWRRIGPTGPMTYLGVAGGKKFVDETLPAGSADLTYKIQALRSTKVGEAATFNVNFGLTHPLPTNDRRTSLQLAA